ncbi:MAG: DUF89 family protein [Bacteroidales bacterium]|nr:DUF89 family protein [Bacteroidales bacterium]
MRKECYSCHIKTVEKLIQKFQPDKVTAENFISEAQALLDDVNTATNPYLARTIHSIARKHLKHDNLYQEEKTHANNLLLEHYQDWRDRVVKSDIPFYTAAKLAVIGNIIDYGAHSVNGNILQQINELMTKELAIDQTVELYLRTKNAQSILYLGDNAGEIVFDSLFLEIMRHPNVTYAVRGKPVINDVTFEDASQCNMHEKHKIISNGSDAPSTLLDLCSNEFIEIFNHADLIISKGQGNFEGLMNTNNPKIFYLLIAKCDPMADLLHVNKGDMVVTQYIN